MVVPDGRVMSWFDVRRTNPPGPNPLHLLADTQPRESMAAVMRLRKAWIGTKRARTAGSVVHAPVYDR
jgi:hypothetical protein